MAVRSGSLPRAVGIAVLVVAVQAVFLALFAWPAVNSEPRDLPVVATGPAPAVQQLVAALEQAEPGAFDVSVVADETAADQAIRDRKAYGAFILSPSGAAVHVASAAGPVVAQLLGQVAQAAGGGQPVQVTDVVPADQDDPRGSALAIGILPLVMTSMLAAALLRILVSGRIARVVGVLAYGVLAGLAATAILQYGLSALPGDYLTNAAVVGLLAAAMTGAITGLAALLGYAGIGLGVVVMFLVGNPLSGLTSAPEFLPQPWGDVGQALPPGAGGTLLRSVASFDGAGAQRPALVLAAWAVAGLVLIMVGRSRAMGDTSEADAVADSRQSEPAGA